MGNRQHDQFSVILIAGAVTMGVAGAAVVMVVDPSPIKALVGGAAGMALFGALVSAEAALYCTIAIACVDGFLKGIVPGMTAMLAKDIFLGIALIHWAWDGLNGQPRRSLHTRAALPAFIFGIYCVAQMFNSETVSWMLALAGLRTWVIWIPVYVIAYDTIKTRNQFERFVLFIAVVSAGTGVYIVAQHQVGFDALYEMSPGFGFYDHFEQGNIVRAPGTYVHPGTAGSAMAFAALVCLGVALASRAFSLRQVVLLGCGAVCGVAMAATGSRAPLVGMVIGVVAFMVLCRRPALLIPIALVGMLAIGQTSRFAGDLVERRYSARQLNVELIWDRAMFPIVKGYKLLSEHPFGTGVASGVGAGRAYSYVEQDLEVNTSASAFVENEIGRAMKELGMPGFLLFVWLLWASIASGMRGWRASRGRDRLLVSGLLAGAVGMVAQLMVGSALYLAPGGIYFWAACALAARIPDYMEQDAAALIPERTTENDAEWQTLLERAGHPA